MSKEEFADRLRRLMVAKNTDVAKLAERGQLKPSAVYQWLAAKFMPRGEGLAKVARALDVSTDYLLTGSGYEGFGDREIAVHESLALYLKSEGITPAHPDYEIYERLRTTDRAPVTLEEWQGAASVLAVAQEYATKRKPAKSARAVRRIGNARDAGPMTGTVVQLQKSKNRNAS
jgi:transcriptional regulator with XRE-family HTH domain